MVVPHHIPAKALKTVSVVPAAVAGTAALLSVYVYAGLLLRLRNPWTPRA